MSKQLKVQTSDKVKQKYQNKLGEEFGAVFHDLWNDRAWAWIRLQEYRELFRQYRARRTSECPHRGSIPSGYSAHTLG